MESLQETCTSQTVQNGVCKLVLSVGTKHCRVYMDLWNKMHVCLLDAEMVTVAKTEACSSFGRMTWGSCSVPFTLPLNLSQSVPKAKEWGCYLPLLSHRIESA